MLSFSCYCCPSPVFWFLATLGHMRSWPARSQVVAMTLFLLKCSPKADTAHIRFHTLGPLGWWLIIATLTVSFFFLAHSCNIWRTCGQTTRGLNTTSWVCMVLNWGYQWQRQITIGYKPMLLSVWFPCWRYCCQMFLIQYGLHSNNGRLTFLKDSWSLWPNICCSTNY